MASPNGKSVLSTPACGLPESETLSPSITMALQIAATLGLRLKSVKQPLDRKPPHISFNNYFIHYGVPSVIHFWQARRISEGYAPSETLTNLMLRTSIESEEVVEYSKTFACEKEGRKREWSRSSKEEKFDEVADTYKVRDISLADLGRKELDLAEVEMPILMSHREKFGPSQPLRGVEISGSVHMTLQTAVLIETLQQLGATLRWASCNIFSTQDHAAAVIARDGSSAVFAWKGQTLDDYWDCIERMLTWPNSDGPDMIVDDGGDAILLIHEGAKWEKQFAANQSKPDPSSTDDEKMQCVLWIIRNSLETDPLKWTRMAKKCKGVSSETPTALRRLYQMAKNGELLFPAINVNDSIPKSMFNSIQSLATGIVTATEIEISGLRVVICGYGDAGKGCAMSLRSHYAEVVVTEIDPICALQACGEGFPVVRLEDVVEEVDIVVTATGRKGIVMKSHMARMKNNTIVCSVGHLDNEIDMSGLTADEGIKRQNIKPQVDRWIFPDGHGVLILGEGRLMELSAPGPPRCAVISKPLTKQVFAQLELWINRDTGKFKGDVYKLLRKLDEKEAALHMAKFGLNLTLLSPEQADCSKIWNGRKCNDISRESLITEKGEDNVL